MKNDCSHLYQPLRAETLADPYPTYHRLLSKAPVMWHGDLFAWVLSRYSDCRMVLQNHANFTRDRRKLGRPVPAEGMSIQSVDPPDQIQLRRSLLSSFRRIDLASVSREACVELEYRLRSQPKGQSFDFMSQVAAPVAMRFACSLVGMPDLRASAYFSIFERLTRAMDSALAPDRHDAGVDATRELNELIVCARRSAAPRSVIFELQAMPNVAQMPIAFVRNTISATFNAAYSTAYSSMGSFLVLAQERPGLAKRIVETKNVAAGVQELLRFTCPAQSTRRYATCDTIIGDMVINQNDPVLTLMAAANRDPDMFEKPYDLVLDRSPNQHLSFGSGAHHCAGARPAAEFLGEYIMHLAYWESKLILAGPTSWLETFTLRCLDKLPVIRNDRPTGNRGPN